VLQVTVWDEITGDTETVLLRETGANTGEFKPAVPLLTAPPPTQPGDGKLQTLIGSTLWGLYTDPNLANDHCYLAEPVMPWIATPVLLQRVPIK
jgi:hypothetical protein